MITYELNELSNSYNIVLTEKLSVVDSDDFEQLLILKTTADKHATLERIFDRNNIYKISDNKNSKFNNYILNNEIDSNYKFDLYFKFRNLNYLILNLENIFENNNQQNMGINTFYDILVEPDPNSSSVSSLFLIFIMSFAGFVLLQTNVNYTKNTRKFLCLSLFIILSSSAVIGPLSISNSYWGMAYAEEFSFDGIIEDVQNNLDSNATSTEPLPVNATSTEPIIIPEATVAFQFDNVEPESTETTPESTETTPESESTTLELDGQGDFIQIQNVTMTDDIDGLTVTAWVKPDYSSGSPEFTVISKDKSFALTINNNIQSENTAKFSVFDGIK